MAKSKPKSAMTKAAVMKLLKENRDERGITHWQKQAKKLQTLKSFGIGLTKLRKLAKQIGKDHKLAMQLWRSDVYDARIIGLLIDDPKEITIEQAENQVDDLHHGMLSHVFASCDATLAKSAIAFDLACNWIDDADPMRRRCGYSLIYELSKKPAKGHLSAMDDPWCIDRINHIQSAIHKEEMWVREAMNTALMGLGKRNATLNKAAIKAAKKIGPVDIDYGDDNRCEPLDVLKHLTSESTKKKLKL